MWLVALIGFIFLLADREVRQGLAIWLVMAIIMYLTLGG